MKRYKLLKDLPFAKAGEIFQQNIGTRSGKDEPVLVSPSHITTSLWAKDIKNFDEWFEEIKEPEVYYYLSEAGAVIESEWTSGTHYAHVLTGEEFIQNLKSIGNYFKTREEAEKHLEWLKARAVLIQDTKGFKPDWTDFYQPKWCVEYDFKDFDFNISFRTFRGAGEIYFATREDLEKSIEAHEKEWKIYLRVE